MTRRVEWSDEDTEALIAMAANGKTDRVIAQHLGRTRNAIIGRRSRLGVACACATASKAMKKKAERQRMRFPERRSRKRRTISEAPPIPTGFAVVPGGKALSDIEDDECRFPVASYGTSHRFCGHRTTMQPYCEVHASIAYGKEK